MANATKKRRRTRRPLKSQTIQYLASDIEEAHVRWRRMSASDRSRVVAAIADRFGWDFAKEFRKVAESGPYKRRVHNTGEERFNRQWLLDRGYRFQMQIAPGYEMWVRPDGRTISLFLRPRRQIQSVPAKGAPAAPGGRIKGIPDQLPDISGDEEAMEAYGDIVADKVVTIFGTAGLGTLYDDGTIEFSNDNNDFMTMRPVPGSYSATGKVYELYDATGERQNVIFTFDPEKILQD